jgi:mandelate racemase
MTTPQLSAASQPLTIAGLRVRAVNPPLAVPHNTASGTVNTFPMVLLDIVTDAGISGASYVFTYTPLALKPVAQLLQNLEALLKGQPCAPQELEQMLRKRFRLLGPQGFVGMAIAAIDMAAWDAQCKAANLPLARMLGGSSKPLRAYAAVGMSGVAGSAQEAEHGVRAGFSAVKAKIGYPSVEEDVQVVRAIRKAVGEGVHIMVDYNQSLLVPEAIHRAKALDNEGVTWVEEPTLAEDYAGHAQIKAAAHTPVQAGENWWGPIEFRKAINVGATDLLMPDVMKLGGITPWLKVMAMGEVYGMPVSNHLFPEVSSQLMAVTPTASWFEYADWSNPIMAQPTQVKDGMVIASDAPGIGITWDEAAIQRYLVE